MFGDFVHDDVAAILKNPDVNPSAVAHRGQALNVSAWGSSGVWSNDFWGTPMGSIMSHNSYRPLTTILFRMLFALGGGGAKNKVTITFFPNRKGFVKKN